jgi:hypothetical protein
MVVGSTFAAFSRRDLDWLDKQQVGCPQRFAPLLLWRRPKAHAWSATVLVDELDARGLLGSADCLIVSST